MSLADLVKAQKKVKRSPLSPAITKQLMRMASETRRPYDGLFHPSQVSHGLCARFSQIDRRYRESTADGLPAESPSPGLMAIFELGTIMHKWFQDDVLGPAQVLWGHWYNPQTKEIRLGFQPEAWQVDAYVDATGREIPSKVKIWNWWYVEPRIYNKELHIGGAIDGLVLLEGRWYILEIKTMNTRGHEFLQGPTLAHQKQGTLYAGCQIQVDVSEGEHAWDGVTPQQVVFLYSNKNDSNYDKQYVMDFNKDLWDELTAPIVAFRAAEEEKSLLPKLKECLRANSKRAKNCAHHEACFFAGRKTAGWLDIDDWIERRVKEEACLQDA